MSSILRMIIFVCACYFASYSHAYGSQLTIHIGPPSPGMGGSNPISIPPINIVDYELVYLTDSLREWTLGLIPGLFYGVRSTKDPGPYLSAGGGIVINANGVGPGVYGAVGLNAFCGDRFCFNLEYKQAIGIAGGLISPYAIRLGVGIYFH
jgi:hypothetical protein